MALSDTERLETLASYVPRQVLRHAASGGPGERAHSEEVSAAFLLIDITGFTPMVAAAAQRGAAGTEALARSINSYLGQAIDVVWQHGGDISKFVGDALIPVWTAADEDLSTTTSRAASCALALTQQLSEDVPGGAAMSVKVGLCAGDLALMHVGGVGDRWLFVAGGPAIAQLSALQQYLATGDVIASPEAWSLIADRFVGQPLSERHVRVRSTGQPAVPRALDSLTLANHVGDRLRAYIPRVLLSRIDAGQQNWLTEMRRTSVVFISVRGMTTAAADALDKVHRLAQTAQRIAARYDGWSKEVTVDEKGTSVMVVFGVPPFTHEDDESRAVSAALAFEAEMRAQGYKVGVGIASGATFCGPVGNDRRRDFAMLGEHVNLASRLMQAADDSTVLVDAATYDVGRTAHAFQRLPAHVLKGLGAPTDVYRVLPVDSNAPELTGLVDRQAERSAAAAALEGLARGQGDLVIIEGDPGIGKSRLVAEWVHLAREQGVSVYRGQASEIESGTQYHAWRQVFEDLLGLTNVSANADRAEMVRARLETTGSSADLAPLLSSLLSLDLPESSLTAQLGGAARGDNTVELLVGLLRVTGGLGAMMIVIEDVHWLDSASWQLIERVRSELPSALVVLTTRQIAEQPSERVGALREEAMLMPLPSLSRVDAVALAAQRSGASDLDDRVAALVYDRAEGNPLFIEQLTYALRDTGNVVLDHGILRSVSDTDGGAPAIIPDSVQRVITTRLDKLPPQLAMTIKVASVIGPRFGFRTLANIHPLTNDADALNADLETLTRLGLVAPAAGAESTYEFSHKITQEVAYNLMPSAQSRQLHHDVAQWYERVHAHDLSPFLAYLAHHWRAADAPDRAVDYLEQAGLDALRTFANEEAIEFLQEALDLEAKAKLDLPPSRRARWLLALGDAYVNLSRYRDGRSKLEQGLRLLDKAPPQTRGRRALSLVGQIARQGRHRAGVRGRRRISDQERQELVAVSRAYERLAEAAYYEGDTMLALYSTIRILNEAEASGSAPEIARGLAGTGALFGIAPLPGLAESYLRRAQAALEQTDDVTTHEISRVSIAFYYVGAGMWDAARGQLNHVRATATRLGDRRRLMDAVANLVDLEYLQGWPSKALTLAEELAAMAKARGDRRFEADALVARAYAQLELGRVGEALRTLDEVRVLTLRTPDLPEELPIKMHGLLSLISVARNDRRAAVASADAAMRLTAGHRPTYFTTFLGFVGPVEAYLAEWESGQATAEVIATTDAALKRLRSYARVFPIGRPRYESLAGRRASLRGDHQAALRHWRRSLDEATRLAMPYEQGLAQFEMGRHLASGNPARGRHLTAARDALTPLGATRLLTEVDMALVVDG